MGKVDVYLLFFRGVFFIFFSYLKGVVVFLKFRFIVLESRVCGLGVGELVDILVCVVRIVSVLLFGR